MGANILMFHMAGERQRQAETVCRRLGITCAAVPLQDYCQPLGALAGILGFARKKERYRGSELPGEMLVLSGLDGKRVDDFLAAWREAGIPPVALKAIVTPHNIRWTPTELYAELLREHRAI